MIHPTSLPGVHIQNDGNGIMHDACSARLQSPFLDQTHYSDTASDTGACNHKHAIASHIRSRGKRRPQLSASQ